MSDPVIVLALNVLATVSADDARALNNFQFSAGFHVVCAEQVKGILASRMPLLNWTVTPLVPDADPSGG